MKVLVTGAQGFVGKNLVTELKNRQHQVFSVDTGTSNEDFKKYCAEAEFIFHLAGVNRPKNESEFMTGNCEFTVNLIDNLKNANNLVPIMLSSSMQAVLDNPYGVSKRAGEAIIRQYSEELNVPVFIYRFPGIYGKWSRPNYNTVVATFCYNIARDLPVQVNAPEHEIDLVYIDDVVNSLVSCLKETTVHKNEICTVSEVDRVSLQQLHDLVVGFKESRKTLAVPNLANRFEKNLYSTYLSFLPEDDFSYNLKMNVDQRGSFTEILRTPDRGQVSVNISKPGITKGNHWHHTKNEKFLVVSGRGAIRFRDMSVENGKVIEYFVSGDKLQVVDIPVGYTHNIENLGDTDMVTLMWVNEPFDPTRPDTYYVEV